MENKRTYQDLEKENEILRKKLAISVNDELVQAMGKSENELRLLFNAMTDIVFEMDYDGVYLNIAPTSPELMFKPPDDTVGKTVHEVFPKAEADFFLGFIRSCIDDNEIKTIEYPLIINDKTVWFEGRACPKANDSILYIGRDITDRKLAEENLKKQIEDYEALSEEYKAQNEDLVKSKKLMERSEERYKDLFNKNPLSLWEEDFSEVIKLLDDKKKEGITNFKEYFDENPDFVAACSASIRIINVNPATLSLLKYKSESDLLSNISAIFNQKSFETFKNELLAILQNQELFSEETEFVCATGETISAIVQYQQINDFKKLVFTITDITEAKKSEFEIQKQNTELSKLNATKDKFFSIIAHDLKSPFNTMLGFSKLLVHNFDSFDVPKQKQFLDVLSRNISNTYKLLENLLLWSSSQRGAVLYHPERENLYLLVMETIELLNPSAVKKSISLINRVSEEVYVHADKNMLSTILRNLISNAIKFTPKGGNVEIGCRVSPVKTRHGVSHEIYVKDSGVGIREEKLLTIFNVSDKISTIGTDGETGTGLGLTICKEFVTKHDGEIWVKSEIGKGSEFTFTLPEIR